MMAGIMNGRIIGMVRVVGIGEIMTPAGVGHDLRVIRAVPPDPPVPAVPPVLELRAVRVIPTVSDSRRERLGDGL